MSSKRLERYQVVTVKPIQLSNFVEERFHRFSEPGQTEKFIHRPLWTKVPSSKKCQKIPQKRAQGKKFTAFPNRGRLKNSSTGHSRVLVFCPLCQKFNHLVVINLRKMGLLVKSGTSWQKFIFWPPQGVGWSLPSSCGDQFMSGGKKLLMTLDNETFWDKNF